VTSRDALLAQFDRETATTRRLLERMPAERLSWSPHPKSTSFAGLGRHLAHMISWGPPGLTAASTDVRDRPPLPPTPALADILHAFDANVAAVRALLAGRTDAELAEVWTLTHEGQPILTSTRYAVVQSLILSHMVHHRGQLSVYLRLNDIPVPAIYGPSADEA